MEVLAWFDVEDVRGINTTWELSQAAQMLNQRCLKFWSDRGVRFLDPTQTWVEPSVKFESDVEVFSSNGEPVVIVRLGLTGGIAGRAVELAQEQVEAVHLYADYCGQELPFNAF